jgi:hypothetical protein
MEKQGSGHVVQITTSLTDHANSRVPALLSALTKGAATKSLAVEYAKRGIRRERRLARASLSEFGKQIAMGS